MPDPPVHDSLEEEQLYRKRHQAAAFRAFGLLGYDEGVAGHMSVRDPIDTDTFWVNPFGRNFAMMRVSDLLQVDQTGTVVHGTGIVNAAAFAIHSAIHEARPDIVAAVHTHSPAGRAWSTLGRLLDPITQDACTFYDDHAVYGPYKGGVLDQSEGDEIAQAIGTGKAAILANHGLLTAGPTVDAAAYWFIAMERSCRVQLDAEAAGTPLLIDPELARATGGSARTGWFCFQPWYERMLAEQPGFLE
ncbi:MAG: class II aldolase/adducin family protein [Ilumatobacteraceae bacterium]|nr:class II aldolase/adducin family protein [Ilumatobacteraceae bacterium]